MHWRRLEARPVGRPSPSCLPLLTFPQRLGRPGPARSEKAPSLHSSLARSIKVIEVAQEGLLARHRRTAVMGAHSLLAGFLSPPLSFSLAAEEARKEETSERGLGTNGVRWRPTDELTKLASSSITSSSYGNILAVRRRVRTILYGVLGVI